MRLEDLDFHFPQGLIAQEPAHPRDSCRLMYLPAEGGREHLVFSNLPGLLRAGDTLVFNDSRVLAARLHARRITGGRVEVLFLRPLEETGRSWEILARPSHRLRVGEDLLLADGVRLSLQTALGEGRWVVAGPPERSVVDIMDEQGELPLPPYIRTYPDDPASYQTVYASQLGSAAAPTAGLHFTAELLEELGQSGVRSAYVTLHVGLDTFQPIREETVEEHRIHRETYYVGAEALRIIGDTLDSRGRLVAVGTTATRVLETLARNGALGSSATGEPVWGETDIFITPGYTFRLVDVLLTNFHLPRSTVLALTMAFAGVGRLRAAYAEAVAMRYRFFSFGDAMLIETPQGGPGADA
ncbi:MAG: tRNA preQ1(34) S-adenosylmethionine ribosyltransferase-isomerase QueA [Thermoleophilia bacterium]|nr:tRNA preQ1(34) S-adenosylmethionine ribosyltransferase-isomerase QueA [Thermoleophilia bacterium]